MARFLVREHDFEIQAFEMLGLRDADAGEVTQKPVVHRLERRTNALDGAEDRNRSARDWRRWTRPNERAAAAFDAPELALVLAPTLRVR
jgi:hypothetical protein